MSIAGMALGLVIGAAATLLVVATWRIAWLELERLPSVQRPWRVVALPLAIFLGLALLLGAIVVDARGEGLPTVPPPQVDGVRPAGDGWEVLDLGGGHWQQVAAEAVACADERDAERRRAEAAEALVAELEAEVERLRAELVEAERERLALFADLATSDARLARCRASRGWVAAGGVTLGVGAALGLD